MLFLLVYYLFISYWMNDLMKNSKNSSAFRKASVRFSIFLWSKIRGRLLDFFFKKAARTNMADKRASKKQNKNLSRLNIIHSYRRVSRRRLLGEESKSFSQFTHFFWYNSIKLELEIKKVLNILTDLISVKHAFRPLFISQDNFISCVLTNILSRLKYAYGFQKWFPGALTNTLLIKKYIKFYDLLNKKEQENNIESKMPKREKTLRLMLFSYGFRFLRQKDPHFCIVLNNDFYLYPILNELLAKKILSCGLIETTKGFSFSIFGNSKSSVLRLSFSLLVLSNIIKSCEVIKNKIRLKNFNKKDFLQISDIKIKENSLSNKTKKIFHRNIFKRNLVNFLKKEKLKKINIIIIYNLLLLKIINNKIKQIMKTTINILKMQIKETNNTQEILNISSKIQLTLIMFKRRLFFINSYNNYLIANNFKQINILNPNQLICLFNSIVT